MTAAPVTSPLASQQLRWLADAYEQTQKLRVAIGNRIDAVERGSDSAPVASSVARLYEGLVRGERDIYAEMKEVVELHPAWPWLGHVRGIGPTLGAKLLGLIGDISTYDTVSKLWRVAGYAVVNGKRERPQAAVCPHCGARGRAKSKPHQCPVTGEAIPLVGAKLHYSVRLKTTVYLCGASFLKCGSPYRKLYDQARARYEAREASRPHELRWTLAHRHLAAMRVMNKIFLSHLWEVWRRALQLPVREPYVLEKLGHTRVLSPWDFVEPQS